MKNLSYRILIILTTVAILLIWTDRTSAQATSGTSTSVPDKKPVGGSEQNKGTKNISSVHQATATAVLDPRLISGRKNGYIMNHNPDAKRKCTPRSGHDPWSISKPEFDKLPVRTQEFILKHPEKYTITN